MVLTDWDLSPDGIDSILNNDLGDVLAVFGVKKSGSIRERRQRLFLHLNHDAKQLTPEKLDNLSRDKLHELCSKLDLPRSGTKQALLMRVAGVLTSQSGSWGVIKKSLRRPRGAPKLIQIPVPSDEDEIVTPTLVENTTPPEPEVIEIEPAIIEQPVVDEVEIIEILPSNPVTIDTPPVFEISHSVIEIEDRVAEIDALCRDFLLVGSINDTEDVNAFISSLSSHGFNLADENARNFVKSRLHDLDRISKQEKEAIHTMPNSWREREALRLFEESRGILRDSLPEIIESNSSDMVKARMAFEDKARGLNLDMRLPSVSGRVHALFDLQVSLNDEIAATDPKTARRTRIIRLLQHGAIHLSPKERRTLDRLERNIDGFEQLVEAIFDKSGGSFGDSQQALVIRFLEKKGYEVNNAELRPRVIAAAGVLGAEFGHISPSEIPRIAPGIKVSDTEVESIIADLKKLAYQFKEPNAEEVDEELELAESVADAADRVAAMRSRIDGVDELLAKLNLSNN